jgi:hypothetical protein
MLQRNDLNPQHAALAQQILVHGIDAAEVARLHDELFADGVLNADAVRLLFYLNEQAPGGHDPAWYDFFVEALTDYFVWRQRPQGHMSVGDAALLAELVEADGRIDDATEFALLINVLHRLVAAPDRLVEVALRGVKQTVLGGGAVLFGPQRRRPGVIDDADAVLIRAVVFASGGDGSLNVTRREADLLVDLNRATRGRKNAPDWRTLFVEAVGHHVMHGEQAPAAPSGAEAQARERWIDRRRGTGSYGAGTAAALQARIALALGRPAPAAAAPRDAVEAPEPLVRRAVEAEPARWLADRLAEDDTLDDNTVALLAYLKRTSTRLDPALAPLLAQAGIGVETKW